MATPIYVKLNTVDWSHKCADITPIIRDTKKSATGLSGVVRILKPRSTVLTNAVTLQFPYLSAEDMQTIKALVDDPATATINLDHNMDMPKGDMVPMEFTRQLVKVMSTIRYNVGLTLAFSYLSSSPAGLTAHNPGTFHHTDVTGWVG